MIARQGRNPDWGQGARRPLGRNRRGRSRREARFLRFVQRCPDARVVADALMPPGWLNITSARLAELYQKFTKQFHEQALIQYPKVMRDLLEPQDPLVASVAYVAPPSGAIEPPTALGDQLLEQVQSGQPSVEAWTFDGEPFFGEKKP